MAQFLGFIYALFLIISNFGKTAKKILLIQTMAFFFKSIHYYLLGGVSGFLTSLVSMIRNLLFSKKACNLIWTIIFITIFIGIAVISYKGVYTLFPVLATIIYTIIINYEKPKYLRVGMLITSMSWLLYNIYVESWAGTVIQIILLISNITAIIKLDKKPKMPYNT